MKDHDPICWADEQGVYGEECFECENIARVRFDERKQISEKILRLADGLEPGSGVRWLINDIAKRVVHGRV